MKESTRVIKNTAFLYLNMLVTMSVQLIAVRLLYQGLGVVDYGLYNLVAGLIALFSFMNVAMAAATQRFLSYENGHDNAALLKETFYQSVVLHTGIGLVVLLLLPIGGGYYITHFIHAPADRLLPACLLLVAISCSTFVNIITVPYEAVMNAHEDLGVVALLNICDSLLKLFTALYVCYWASGDRLITFGVLTMASLILILVLKRLYALRHYPEAHFRWHRVAWNDLRPMASFGAWNFIGAGCSIGRYQGTALILNYFFGIAINAAYGIAQQVNGLLLFLANTIVRAIRPQIVKSEGAGNRQRMLRLSETTCRVTALMVALIAIPFFIEMEYVLRLWLGKMPSAACIMFCRAFIVIVFINQLTIGLQVAVESEGHIRKMQLIVGSMHILALPVSYLFYRAGYPVMTIMWCIIAEEIIALLVRTRIAQKQTGLRALRFLYRGALIPACVCTVVLSVMYCLANTLPSSFLRVTMTSFISVMLVCALSYAFALTQDEKRVITDLIHKLWRR